MLIPQAPFFRKLRIVLNEIFSLTIQGPLTNGITPSHQHETSVGTQTAKEGIWESVPGTVGSCHPHPISVKLFLPSHGFGRTRRGRVGRPCHSAPSLLVPSCHGSCHIHFSFLKILTFKWWEMLLFYTIQSQYQLTQSVNCYQSEPMSIQRKTVHACQAKTVSWTFCCAMPLYFLVVFYMRKHLFKK